MTNSALVKQPPRRTGATTFYMGRFRREVQPLTLLYTPFLTEKVTLVGVFPNRLLTT